MNINEITSLGLKYESGYLESGSYRVYHTEILPENLMTDKVFTHTDLEVGVKFYTNSFPSTMINIIENDIQYSFVLEKL